MNKQLEIKLAGNFEFSLLENKYVKDEFLAYKLFINSLKKYNLPFNERLFMSLENKYNQWLER